MKTNIYQPCSRVIFSGDFDFVVDLGVIDLPENYNHPTFVSRERDIRKRARFFSDEFDSIPCAYLMPGNRIKAFLCRFNDRGRFFEPNDAVNFLYNRNAVFLGTHGLFLVLKNCSSLLPQDKLIISFGFPFFNDSGSSKDIFPSIVLSTEGGIDFNRGHYNVPLISSQYFLGFFFDF